MLNLDMPVWCICKTQKLNDDPQNLINRSYIQPYHVLVSTIWYNSFKLSRIGGPSFCLLDHEWACGTCRTPFLLGFEPEGFVPQKCWEGSTSSQNLLAPHSIHIRFGNFLSESILIHTATKICRASMAVAMSIFISVPSVRVIEKRLCFAKKQKKGIGKWGKLTHVGKIEASASKCKLGVHLKILIGIYFFQKPMLL